MLGTPSKKTGFQKFLCRQKLMYWMYFDTHWYTGCKSMPTYVLDVCWCTQMSWMYVDAHRWMLMLTNGLDEFQHSPMSWMIVNALRCSRCILMLNDVLDVFWCSLMYRMILTFTDLLNVFWCSLMYWMYVDADLCLGCMFMLADVLDVCRCSPI